MARYVRSRLRAGTESAGRRTRLVNDFLVVPVDGETAPFDDPADLEGMPVLFTRRDGTTFAFAREKLVYDAEAGPLFESFGRGATTK